MGYKQSNNPFSRRTSSPLFSGHNRSMTVMLPSSRNKITTSIDNTNLNEQGQNQSFVLNNAYKTIQQRINEANNFANDFNLDNMSLEEATRFDEAEANAMKNLSEAEENFIRVSDSINNVNKKRFTPLKMTSPLNDNHDWEETLQDERDGYNVGDWGNETRVENPDGSITITQTRDLNKQGGGGGGFVNPAQPNQTWDEWLETPEGIEWRSKNPGQDTRSRTIRKREPSRAVSTLTGEGITDVSRDIDIPEIRKVVTPMTEDDMNRKRREIEQSRKDDERSNRKRRRKRWWSNVTGDIGDFVGDVGRGIGNVGRGIGKGAEFVGRGLLDVALAPVDITRGALFPCNYCNKGLGSNIMDRTSLFGGRRGLRKLL